MDDDKRRRQREYHAALDAQVNERQRKEEASRQRRRGGNQQQSPPQNLPPIPTVSRAHPLSVGKKNEDFAPSRKPVEVNPFEQFMMRSPESVAVDLGGVVAGFKEMSPDVASAMAKLSEEVDRGRDDAARQANAALRMHQREAEGVQAMRERLRSLETAVAEERAGREAEALRVRLAGSADSETSAVLRDEVQELRRELHAERQQRAQDAQLLGNSLEALRGGALRAEQQAQQAVSKAVEDALRRERSEVQHQLVGPLAARLEATEQQVASLQGSASASEAAAHSQRVASLEAAVKKERGQRRAALGDVAKVMAAAKAQAEKDAAHIRKELLDAQHQLNAEQQRNAQDFEEQVYARLEEGERRHAAGEAHAVAVEAKLAASTGQALRSLHGSLARVEEESGLKQAELKQVLSAEIAARQGKNRLLSSSLQELASHGVGVGASQEQALKLDALAKDLRDRLAAVEKSNAIGAGTTAPLSGKGGAAAATTASNSSSIGVDGGDDAAKEESPKKEVPAQAGPSMPSLADETAPKVVTELVSKLERRIAQLEAKVESSSAAAAAATTSATSANPHSSTQPAILAVAAKQAIALKAKEQAAAAVTAAAAAAAAAATKAAAVAETLEPSKAAPPPKAKKSKSGVFFSRSKQVPDEPSSGDSTFSATETAGASSSSSSSLVSSTSTSSVAAMAAATAAAAEAAAAVASVHEAEAAAMVREQEAALQHSAALQVLEERVGEKLLSAIVGNASALAAVRSECNAEWAQAVAESKREVFERCEKLLEASGQHQAARVAELEDEVRTRGAVVERLRDDLGAFGKKSAEAMAGLDAARAEVRKEVEEARNERLTLQAEVRAEVSASCADARLRSIQLVDSLWEELGAKVQAASQESLATGARVEAKLTLAVSDTQSALAAVRSSVEQWDSALAHTKAGLEGAIVSEGAALRAVVKAAVGAETSARRREHAQIASDAQATQEQHGSDLRKDVEAAVALAEQKLSGEQRELGRSTSERFQVRECLAAMVDRVVGLDADATIRRVVNGFQGLREGVEGVGEAVQAVKEDLEQFEEESDAQREADVSFLSERCNTHEEELVNLAESVQVEAKARAEALEAAEKVVDRKLDLEATARRQGDEELGEELADAEERLERRQDVEAALSSAVAEVSARTEAQAREAEATDALASHHQLSVNTAARFDVLSSQVEGTVAAVEATVAAVARQREQKQQEGKLHGEATEEGKTTLVETEQVKSGLSGDPSAAAAAAATPGSSSSSRADVGADMATAADVAAVAEEMRKLDVEARSDVSRSRAEVTAQLESLRRDMEHQLFSNKSVAPPSKKPEQQQQQQQVQPGPLQKPVPTTVEVATKVGLQEDTSFSEGRPNQSPAVQASPPPPATSASSLALLSVPQTAAPLTEVAPAAIEPQPAISAPIEQTTKLDNSQPPAQPLVQREEEAPEDTEEMHNPSSEPNSPSSPPESTSPKSPPPPAQKKVIPNSKIEMKGAKESANEEKQEEGGGVEAAVTVKQKEEKTGSTNLKTEVKRGTKESTNEEKQEEGGVEAVVTVKQKEEKIKAEEDTARSQNIEIKPILEQINTDTKEAKLSQKEAEKKSDSETKEEQPSTEKKTDGSDAAMLHARFNSAADVNVDGGGSEVKALSKTAFKKLVLALLKDISVAADAPGASGEAAAAAVEAAGEPKGSDLEAAFVLADADNSGSVDFREFQKLYALVRSGEVSGLGGKKMSRFGLFGDKRTTDQNKKAAQFQAKMKAATRLAVEVTAKDEKVTAAVEAKATAQAKANAFADLSKSRSSQDDAAAKQAAERKKEVEKPRVVTINLLKPLGMRVNPNKIVSAVDQGGQGEALGITVGSLLLAVSGEAVGTLKEFKASVAKLKEQGNATCELEFSPPNRRAAAVVLKTAALGNAALKFKPKTHGVS